MEPIKSALDGLVTRLGTMLTAAFLGYGLSEEHVNVLVPAILVIAGVAFDMATGYLVKKRKQQL